VVDYAQDFVTIWLVTTTNIGQKQQPQEEGIQHSDRIRDELMYW